MANEVSASWVKPPRPTPPHMPGKRLRNMSDTARGAALKTTATDMIGLGGVTDIIRQAHRDLHRHPGGDTPPAMVIMTVIMIGTTIAAANTTRPRRHIAETQVGAKTQTGAEAGDTTDTLHRQAPLLPAAVAIHMAARAALEAGGLTAYRLRKEPGSWTGGKAAKIATAALGAAALDAFMDQDPRSAKRGLKGMAENAVSSLIASQIMGRASKSKSR
ncbi:hypothetical protein F5Y14DRAFT_449920 [Nemania sp. NC0429]|nr:hypothetical protein F5Y14DRAFT_449920 [Nemania sp. NC0429]